MGQFSATVNTADVLLPALRTRIAEHLNGVWQLEVADPGSLRFSYPTTQNGAFGYIRPDVLIEFGHADSWPAHEITIAPYVSEVLRAVTGTVTVRILDPQRTFWEKATILHEIAHRDNSLPFPARYSRHYYDLTRLANSPFGETALTDTELLAAVVCFKKAFFASNRARYDLAKPGTLLLVPPGFRRREIAEDYKQMLPMLFGDVPTIDDLWQHLAPLEERINGK